MLSLDVFYWDGLIRLFAKKKSKDPGEVDEIGTSLLRVHITWF